MRHCQRLSHYSAYLAKTARTSLPLPEYLKAENRPEGLREEEGADGDRQEEEEEEEEEAEMEVGKSENVSEEESAAAVKEQEEMRDDDAAKGGRSRNESASSFYNLKHEPSKALPLSIQKKQKEGENDKMDRVASIATERKVNKNRSLSMEKEDKEGNESPWYDGTRYKCTVCKRCDFKDMDVLGHHHRTVHKMKPKRGKGKSSWADKIVCLYLSDHNCRICGTKVLLNRMDIRNHVRDKHQMQFVVYESRFKLNSKTTTNEPAVEGNEDVLGTSDVIATNDDHLNVNSDEAMDVTNQTPVVEESPDTTNEHMDEVNDNGLETSDDLTNQPIVEDKSPDTEQGQNLSFVVKEELLIPNEDLDAEREEPEHSEESALMITEVVEHSSITSIPWDKTKSEEKLELEKRSGIDHPKDQEQERTEKSSLMISSITGDANDIFSHSKKGNSKQV